MIDSAKAQQSIFLYLSDISQVLCTIAKNGIAIGAEVTTYIEDFISTIHAKE
jgi:hypothetical protein